MSLNTKYNRYTHFVLIFSHFVSNLLERVNSSYLESKADNLLYESEFPTEDQGYYDPNDDTRRALNDTLRDERCNSNLAGPYPCNLIDLEAFMPLSEIGGSDKVGDIWGWTDSIRNNDYALIGTTDGVSFIDISDPIDPLYVGNLEGKNGAKTDFRDIKTYRDYAYIVGEEESQGLQIFSLANLRPRTNLPRSFSETAHFSFRNGGGSARNLAINEDSGYAYVVGVESCNRGIYVLDIRQRTDPEFKGCFEITEPMNDVQCVKYLGLDAEYKNREICFAVSRNRLTIIDVTNKADMQELSSLNNIRVRNLHQGWLTDDHKFFLIGDEENDSNDNALTHLIDISNLEQPQLRRTFRSTEQAQSNNQIVKNKYLYQTHHRGGLRIIDLNRISEFSFTESAFFDTYESNNFRSEDGAVGVYPFYDSGVIVVSSVGEGLFILRPLSLLTPVPTFSMNPTSKPSLKPSQIPSSKPSMRPSSRPSLAPSSKPSLKPTLMPSIVPSKSSKPSSAPSREPSSKPSLTPSAKPSSSPSSKPSGAPTNSPQPSHLPSIQPSSKPSAVPSKEPTAVPTVSPLPSTVPSIEPTLAPTSSHLPSPIPSIQPSLNPSTYPSQLPTKKKPTTIIEATIELIRSVVGFVQAIVTRVLFSVTNVFDFLSSLIDV